MSWWRKKISKWLGMITVRNRDARGRYVADDPSTPDTKTKHTLKSTRLLKVLSKNLRLKRRLLLVLNRKLQ